MLRPKQQQSPASSSCMKCLSSWGPSEVRRGKRAKQRHSWTTTAAGTADSVMCNWLSTIPGSWTLPGTVLGNIWNGNRVTTQNWGEAGSLGGWKSGILLPSAGKKSLVGAEHMVGPVGVLNLVRQCLQIILPGWVGKDVEGREESEPKASHPRKKPNDLVSGESGVKSTMGGNYGKARHLSTE